MSFISFVTISNFFLFSNYKAFMNIIFLPLSPVILQDA